MIDPHEIPHPFTLHHEDGTETVLHLTPNQLEQIGMSMVAYATALRGQDNRPIHEQQKIMDVNEPATSVFFERSKEGKDSVAIVWKSNDMRPVWLWYDAEQAAQLARDILTVSAGNGSKAN